MRRYEPTDDSVSRTIQEAKSSMTNITRTVLRIPSVTEEPYIIYSGKILHEYRNNVHRFYEPGAAPNWAPRRAFGSAQFHLPSIMSETGLTDKLISVTDRGHTRYISEHGEQHLGPDNPADEPTRDYEIAAKLGALRRVLQTLEAQGVIGAAGLDSTDAHDLALKLIAAVRG